jgi:hypothetical protein
MPRSIELDSRVARLRASLDHHLESDAEELFEFVRTYGDRGAYRELERTGAVGDYRATFAPRVFEFVGETERRATEDLLAGPVSLEGRLQRLRSNPWGAYAGMEQALSGADLSRCRSAAMVGCGPLPDSLVYLHERTSIPTVVGYDRDPAALRAARTLAARLGLERVEFADADGRELDYGRFELICPSVFARPRLAIFERIAETATPEAIVLLREPVFTGTLLFEPVLASLPARFEVRAKPRSGPGRLMLRRWLLGLRGRPSRR